MVGGWVAGCVDSLHEEGRMITLCTAQWLSCLTLGLVNNPSFGWYPQKKMKSMNNANTDANNAWLGFSLSPQMNMEVAHSSAGSLFVSPPLTSSGFMYGEGGVGYHYSQLSSIPLKTNGSLCLMEALTRSQQEGTLQNLFPLSLSIFHKNLKCQQPCFLWLVAFTQMK